MPPNQPPPSTATALSIPHRRRNPLTGEWVLVSPQRTLRPWLGRTEALHRQPAETHDSDCYLCPRNSRANSEQNPNYDGTFVFDNDYPALLPDGTSNDAPSNTQPDPIFRSEPVSGRSRVICYSPRHDLTMSRLSTEEIEAVIGVWIEECAHLGQTYPWVQVFENRGATMGASNPHPHGQVWASSSIPTEVALEDENQASHHGPAGRNLLEDYRDQELKLEDRLVATNDLWMACVPFWATWPFEVLVLPRFPARRMDELTPDQRAALARLLSTLLVRYDNLFETPFPYSMGWHGAPYDGTNPSHWLLHGHFYPPLLRSASVRKFMVGYELLAESQRDLTPEDAAAQLRSLPDVHYLDR